ncbi:23889_t:CDS:2, partial [Gigaspora margarita]
MAIVIVYMTKEFNWNHTIQGYVTSSFFFGYITTQIIGGALTDKFGGRKVLSIAAATWTFFTLLTPISARINIYCLILCRICLGVGEGATYPCVSSLISKWFPPEEQSRAISAFGWESIFWVSAIVGSIWTIIWYFYGRSVPKEYPGISKEELEWILKNKSASGSREHMIIDDGHRVPKGENDMLLPKNQISSRPHYVHKIPWKLLFSRREVTYLAKTSLEGLLMMTIGFALYSFKVSSYLVSHLDIAPKYAGVICGIRNTFGMVPALFGIALTGWILEVTANDWSIIWCICSLFYIIGAAIYLAWAGGE